ncbi:calcineurin-like phosphoesterase C-terminal domain-containing protein [Proteiniphilum sp. UBA5384]|uniref:calcineurin-like phosphoesterase C-terminal domain-containing protein n=1 Tax=Proteiniphilum sp. UBA5384 TaxID=1947279 RepID=UPI0025D2EA6F|nr:calcineurin-like phosphoesterase C-terminal domain-containing protein [Proteiniphilum sp. UBA5384]
MNIKTEKTKLWKKAILSLRLLLICGVILLAGLGCSDNDDPIDTPSAFPITNISIPSTLNVSMGQEFTISGKGFQQGDQIHFTSDGGTKYTASVKSATDGAATITLPENITSGRYAISVSRGEQSLKCGSLSLTIVPKTDGGNEIPDKEGMTVKGMVYSDGVGIPGVVVSDGIEVTVTDEKGIYYLPSAKKNGYVFIAVPGNYEVNTNGNLPQFYQQLSAGSGVEQKDFSLIKTDNTNHVVLAMADWHLANRTNDLQQFSSKILPDANATISAYKGQGAKVYVLTLGDLSWDQFWYVNSFALPEYVLEMNKLNCPVFNLIGNHDNDPWIPNDWESENPWRRILGPTYYAFNLGDVHYIVLDNIEFINNGGKQGTVGDRSYNTRIVQDQTEWLKKYLATIEDKTKPVVVGMHAPLFSRPQVNASGNYTSGYAMGGGSAFESAFAGFTNVHVLTGHSHINWAIEKEEGASTFMEHNIGAVCATWWWTGHNGYADNHICKDGSPGGYGIWEMNGKDIKWHYKSTGYDKDYQFRAYDLNKVHITASEFAPGSTDALLAPYAGEYASPNNNNEVLINVFGYDDKWTVEVKENGTPLEVKRVNVKDPLHIVSYSAKRLDKKATPTSSFETHTTSHMFKVQASTATSSLDIKVTDRFGNTYSETMTRPKNFTYSMR